MNTNFPILRQIREIKWPRNCRGYKNVNIFGRENKGKYSIGQTDIDSFILVWESVMKNIIDYR